MLWSSLLSQVAALLIAAGSFVGAWITSTSKRRRIENIKLAAETRSVLRTDEDTQVLDRFIYSELSRISTRLERDESPRRWYSGIRFSPPALIGMGVLTLLVVVFAPILEVWTGERHLPDAGWWSTNGWLILISGTIVVTLLIHVIGQTIRSRVERRERRANREPN